MNEIPNQCLEGCPAEVRTFVSFVHKETMSWGITPLFADTPRISSRPDGGGIASSGFFEDRPTPRLAVGLGKPWQEWLPVLAHEFSHAQQWREQSLVWTNLFKDWGRGVEEASNALDGWLDGTLVLSPEQLSDVVDRARAVELDCERRTIALMRQWNLPIDPTEYAQKAAAYVYFYNHVAKTRQWYSADAAPYELAEVWSCAPRELSDSPTTPPLLQEAFDRNYPTAPRAPRPR